MTDFSKDTISKSVHRGSALSVACAYRMCSYGVIRVGAFTLSDVVVIKTS